jgi:hypothetical protein
MDQDKRHEIKFILNQKELNHFYIKLNLYTDIAKKYNDRHVNSLYFDNANNDSAYDNLIGLSNRRKLRLRWYGNNDKYTDPILELKKKYKNVGSKTYFDFGYIDPYNTSVADFTKRINNYNIYKKINEYDYFFPICMVRYQRSYYESQLNFRMTVDKNIYFEYPNNIKSKRNLINKLNNYHIVELKFSSYNNLNNIIKKFKIANTRCSKYMYGLNYLYNIEY